MHDNSKIIRSRRSIFPRHFNGNEIPKNIILEILENANFAPSHRVTQPWLFKVFAGKSKLNLANEIIHNDNININEFAKEKLLENFSKTSHVICICIAPNLINPEWEEIAATSMAVQNIWLSCVNRNIGGYWSTPTYIKHLNSFLNLKKDERSLGFFYLGCHDTLVERNIKRKSFQEKFEYFD